MPAKSPAKSKSPTSKSRPARPANDREAAPPKAVKAGSRPEAEASSAKVVKIGKRLEAVAREIKDTDEFVEHVAGLAKRYRREHALRAGDAQAELRQSLRIECLALDRGRLAAVCLLQPLGKRAGVLLKGTLDWLARASQAADNTIGEMKQGGTEDALRIAAEGLRATFEHHKLKLAAGSDKKPGDAVRLLCAIAREAGEAIEPAVAKSALRDTNRPAAAA